MSDKPPRAPVRDIRVTETIVDAARVVVATRGLAGMSLRTVAEQAGVSVGSISYRIGDRNELIAALLARETFLAGQAAMQLRDLAGGADPVAADCLADMIGAHLDLMAGAHRTSAIVTSELLLLAEHTPRLLPDVTRLIDANRAMWRNLLCDTPSGDVLAQIISDYCADERPFSISLSDILDYRLLRKSTIRALLRHGNKTPEPAWGRWHMTLVERLAQLSAPALRPIDIVSQSAKAAIAQNIAEVIATHGLGALSHRAIAEAAGMAVSSIAHHFPTQGDIVLGGVEAMYHAMRAANREGDDSKLRRSPVLRLTHECALLASRDPALLPFAIDMRRRRAENVHEKIAVAIGLQPGADRSRTQAIVMSAMGGRMLDTAAQKPALAPGEAYVRATMIEHSS